MRLADELKAAVNQATRSRNGRRVLTCRQALALADRFCVPPRRIGRICDAEGIKLRQCLLGCF